MSDVQPVIAALDVADFQLHCLTHPQPAAIDEIEEHPVTRLPHTTQQPCHLLPRGR